MTDWLSQPPTVYLLCIGIAGVLNYVPPFLVAAWGRIQVGYDLAAPRTMIDKVPPYARRATWAHENSFEAFTLFAAAALSAHVAGVTSQLGTAAALLFLPARLLFSVFYIADFPRARGPMYLVGMLCIGTLMVLSILESR